MSAWLKREAQRSLRPGNRAEADHHLLERDWQESF